MDDWLLLSIINDNWRVSKDVVAGQLSPPVTLSFMSWDQYDDCNPSSSTLPFSFRPEVGFETA